MTALDDAVKAAMADRYECDCGAPLSPFDDLCPRCGEQV